MTTPSELADALLSSTGGLGPTARRIAIAKLISADRAATRAEALDAVLAIIQDCRERGETDLRQIRTFVENLKEPQ